MKVFNMCNFRGCKYPKEAADDEYVAVKHLNLDKIIFGMYIQFAIWQKEQIVKLRISCYSFNDIIQLNVG